MRNASTCASSSAVIDQNESITDHEAVNEQIRGEALRT